MTTTVLAAGDHFVLPRLLTRELRAAAPEGAVLDVRELRLPWPHTPFGPVAGVDEASGTEDELIEALNGVRICLTQMAPLTERVLTACPDLELFCVSRGGPVNADLEAATRHGVAVLGEGSRVRQDWEPEDLIEVWTLLEDDMRRCGTSLGRPGWAWRCC